jgi:hypothetical protein
MKKMRIVTATAVMLLVIVGSTIAQESDMDDRKVRFGLSGAPNLGWLRPGISDLSKSGLQSRMGFGYGLMMDYKFSSSSNYLFSTGVSMTTNGGGMIEAWDSLDISLDNDTNYFYGTLNRTYRLQYVTIPLLLKMRTNEIGYMSYFAAVGLDLGIRTRAFANDDYAWDQEGLVPPDQNDINIEGDMQLFRLGINLTGGGEFNLSGNTNLYVGIGYHNHFTNAFRNTVENKVLVASPDGSPVIENGTAVVGKNKNAVTNYVSLDIGIFF